MGEIPRLAQWVKGSGTVTAAAQFQSVTQEFLYATSADIKKKKKKNKQKAKKKISQKKKNKKSTEKKNTLKKKK